MEVVVRIPIPKEFIGKWCITGVHGTHGSYSILICAGMVFDTKEHAEAYHKYNGYDKIYNEIMQIEADYPVWQTRMFICGLDTKYLNEHTAQRT